MKMLAYILLTIVICISFLYEMRVQGVGQMNKKKSIRTPEANFIASSKSDSVTFKEASPIKPLNSLKL